jgi:hypothetical protein
MDTHMIFRTVLIVIAATALFALIHYYITNSKSAVTSPGPALSKTERFYREGFSAANPYVVPNEPADKVKQSQEMLSGKVATEDDVMPSDENQQTAFRPVDFTGRKLPNDCFPKDRATAEDLLPKDAANLKWSIVNPAGQGDVANANFLQASALQGINSTLGSMRNANLQLRSDPVIPSNGGNWPIMMSTIPRNSAMQRKPLEISGDCGF